MNACSRLVALILWITAILLPTSALADTLEEIQKRGTLQWGADQEGGGPYVYPREDNPDLVTGFEWDLAEKLATHMGVKPEFIQGQWDALPDMLRANKMDIILNGYEQTEDNVAAMEPSMPYFVYGLQLMVREDSPVQSWEDLCKPLPNGKKPKLGALVGSAAETLLMEDPKVNGPCEVIAYDGNTDAMREVETGKLAGTLQDTPIAAFYGPQFPKLRKVGEPVGKGYYVMYARKGEKAVIEKLDAAIKATIQSGDLERIYRKYGIWDEMQVELMALAGPAPVVQAPATPAAADATTSGTSAQPAPSEVVQTETVNRKRGWPVFRDYFGTLARSALTTVALSFISFPLAIGAGLLIAVGRLYGPRYVRLPLTAYVEVLRGTPLMLQLYFLFFFLPEFGEWLKTELSLGANPLNIPAFACAIMGLAINYSAYESEIYRAGLQAIPLGQMEAAESLGMSRAMALRRIIVPQAFRIVIPPVVNDFIALFKDTSVCSVVTVMELTKRFSVLSRSTSATIEIMAMTAILYMLMSYPMSLLARRLEERLGSGGVR